MKYQRQVDLPIIYDGVIFDEGLRLDVLAEEPIICELKAIDGMNLVWKERILIYFTVSPIKTGINRIYSTIENLVLWARSEITGFAIIECHGVLE